MPRFKLSIFDGTHPKNGITFDENSVAHVPDVLSIYESKHTLIDKVPAAGYPLGFITDVTLDDKTSISGVISDAALENIAKHFPEGDVYLAGAFLSTNENMKARRTTIAGYYVALDNVDERIEPIIKRS
jgi:hypothetical protein